MWANNKLPNTKLVVIVYRRVAPFSRGESKLVWMRLNRDP